MKRLLACLLLIGVVGCGGPETEEEAVAALKKLEAYFWLNDQEKVVEIHYYGPKSTDAGLVHLKGLTNLYLLVLYGTRITDAGVAELQKALPDCEILH